MGKEHLDLVKVNERIGDLIEGLDYMLVSYFSGEHYRWVNGSYQELKSAFEKYNSIVEKVFEEEEIMKTETF